MTPQELREKVARIIAGEADRDTVDAGWYLAEADAAIAVVIAECERVCCSRREDAAACAKLCNFKETYAHQLGRADAYGTAARDIAALKAKP